METVTAIDDLEPLEVYRFSLGEESHTGNYREASIQQGCYWLTFDIWCPTRKWWLGFSVDYGSITSIVKVGRGARPIEGA